MYAHIEVEAGEVDHPSDLLWPAVGVSLFEVAARFLAPIVFTATQHMMDDDVLA